METQRLCFDDAFILDAWSFLSAGFSWHQWLGKFDHFVPGGVTGRGEHLDIFTDHRAEDQEGNKYQKHFDLNNVSFLLETPPDRQNEMTVVIIFSILSPI